MSALCIIPGCPHHPDPHFHFTERDPDSPGNWRTSTHWLDTNPPVETAEPEPAKSDLEALQERYPWGSRWRNLHWPEPSIVTVVGWDPGDPSGDLVIVSGTGGAAHARIEHTQERIPDPPPSPITEPVTLHHYNVLGEAHWTTHWTTVSADRPLVHLLPEGQEPPAEAVHSGWWWS